MKNLLLLIGAAAGITGTAFAEQPDKWVSYVESTGSQYVDTGVTGRWNTKIEAKVEWMAFSDSSFVASRTAGYPTNGRMYFCYCLDADGRMYTAQDTGEKVIWNTEWEARFEKNRVYTYTTAFSATNGAGQATNTINVDGLDLWSKASTGVNTGRNLYIFANNQGGSAVSHSMTRCYGLKIWQGPEEGGDMTLKRDFQPCMKGGRAGLYDAVSGTIFYSISGTDLVCDEDSEVPDEYIEYVESQGEEILADNQLPAYIDTGIIGRSGTKVVGEFAILNSEDKGFLGSRAENNRFYLLQSYNSKITCGYGSHKDNNNTLTLGRKYLVETELNAGSQMEKIDSAVVFSATDSSSINTGYPMYLFACNVNGAPDWYSKARCYGFKMWQDGVLVRDFRPCLKNGVAGLYDDVSKRIFYSKGTPLNYETAKSVKAKDVIFVEYIESDGNNTLDTGVPARSGTRAKGVMMWTAEDENGTGVTRTWNRETYRYLEGAPAVFWRNKRTYLGARNIKNSNGWFHMLCESDAVLLSQYESSGEMRLQNGGADVQAYVGVRNSFDVTFANGSQTVEWNGVRALNSSIADTIDTGNNLCLFSSSHWRWRSQARCYGLEIWQDGVQVRDFKPCIYEGKGMLYDMVTKKVYRSSPDIPLSRTGKIILSGDEKPAQYVEYVDSDGTIFVDTGIIGKSGTKAEMEMAFLQSEDRCFLGSRKDSNTRFFLFHNANSKAMVGYGNWWLVPKDQGTATQESPAAFSLKMGQKYNVESSLAAGAQTVKIDGTQYLNDTMSDNIDTGANLWIFASDFPSGNKIPSKSRLYSLKLWQGDANGGNMQLVRDFKPVRLSNGLVVLWDFKNDKPYLPQSTTDPYDFTTFPAVGPDGERIYTSMRIILR